MKDKNIKRENIVKPRRGLVFVGMSGGVDSSVSAAILKEQGYDVVGVFIKVWSPDWLPCSWREERRDAMRCAAILEIPLMTLDLEKAYKQEVVDYMIREYKAGRVPNPDVMCNKSVKFGGFFDEAMKLGADFVATGHYARVEKNNKTGIFELLAGKDRNKDQSYFLWTLGQKHLSKTLFPVGGLKKEEVRKLAEAFGLPTATKKDSQGLCFLGKIDIKDFLKKYIKEKRGRVLNEQGKIIGTHDGAVFYTLGERHGFIVDQKGADDTPYYIVKKDTKRNILVVSHSKDTKAALKRDIEIADLNWIAGGVPKKGAKISARIRYREELRPCYIKKISSKKAVVSFIEPEDSVASGQSLVLYDGDVCLGGGVIK